MQGHGQLVVHSARWKLGAESGYNGIPVRYSGKEAMIRGSAFLPFLSSMRSSLRFRFRGRGFVLGQSATIILFLLVYLAVMVTFAADVQRRFSVHPAITVTLPLALCYGLGWLSIWARRRFQKARPTTAARKLSPLSAGLVVLGVLALLAGLAIAVVEGIVAIARAWN